ncbi:MAG: 3-deoxy-8-phosphooctulonate synthase [Phycisphaerales bacterium]|nr:3-deoxy-8-phosphooctulonate synthase [Phycisphaerales bacterium]
MTDTCLIGPHRIDRPSDPLIVIAGPCVLESYDVALRIGLHVRDVCADLGLRYIFKASYDKANRSSVDSPRGPGLTDGLDMLAQLGRELDVPVTTDIHDPSQAGPVAEVVDLLQIPAFLCRQTDLLVAAAQAAHEHDRAVSVKKGQFVSPREMAGPIRKLREAGCENILLIERGTFFGYHRLVNDFIGLGDLLELGPPVCFDVTHSTQLPGASETSGGRPERAPLLARSAVAAGVHAVFIECHPEPAAALSDASNMLRLDAMRDLLTRLKAIHTATHGPSQ